MATYIDIFVGISIAMIAFQLVVSLIGVPFDGRFLPLRTCRVSRGDAAGGGFVLLLLLHFNEDAVPFDILHLGSFVPDSFLLEICAIVSQCLLNKKYQLLDHK